MNPEDGIVIHVQVEGGEEAAIQFTKVGDAEERAVGKTSDLTKELGFLGRGFQGLRSAFGFALGAGGFAGLTFGISEAIKKAQQMQEAVRQLGSAMKAAGIKSGTEELEGFAKALSTRGGFDPGQNIAALTAFIRVTHSASESQSDLVLATNVARGAHVSLERAVRAVTMAEQGRTTGLARLGVNILPVTTATDRLTAQTGTATAAQRRAAAAVDQHATALLAVKKITDAYSGSTANYATTSAGAIGDLSHTIDILGEDVGQKLIPYITKGALAALRFIAGWKDFTGVGGQAHRVLDTLVGDLKSVGGWASRNRTMLVQLGIVVGTGVGLWKAYRLAVVAAGIAQAAFTAGSELLALISLIGAVHNLGDAWAFLSLMMDANPIGAIIVGIAALTAGFIVAYNKVGWFRQGVQTAFRFVKGAAVDVLHWIEGNWPLILGILTGPFGLAAEQVITHWHAVLSFLQSVPGKILGFFTGLGKGIEDLFANAINAGVIGPINDVIGLIDRIHVKLPHVHIPGIGTIGGQTIAFNIPKIPTLAGAGTSGPTSNQGGVGRQMLGMAQGGLVGGSGTGDTQVRALDPREYVLTPEMVGDVGTSALDRWRGTGDPPTEGGDIVVHTHVALDGKEVGRSLTRLGRLAKAAH